MLMPLLINQNKSDDILTVTREFDNVHLGDRFAFGNDSIWVNGDEGRIYLWKGYKLVDTLLNSYSPAANGPLYFSPDGAILYAGAEVYDINNKKRIDQNWWIRCKLLTGTVSSKEITQVVRDPYSDLLIISYKVRPGSYFDDPDGPDETPVSVKGGKRYVLKVLTKENQLIRIGSYTSDRYKLVLTNDRSIIAVCDDNILVWDKKRLRHKPDTLHNHSSVNGISFTPDGSLLASVDWAGKISLWNIRKKEITAIFETNEGIITHIAFHPSSPIIATSNGSHEISVWSYANNQLTLLQKIKGKEEIKGMSFDKTGVGFYVRSGLYTLTIYDVNLSAYDIKE